MLSGMQKLKYHSSVSDLEFHPAFSAIKALLYVIEHASYAHVSFAVNLHIVEFISNFIKHERHIIIYKHR